jgi:hypothetical protein
MMEDELRRVRAILAGTDAGSLPDDYPTERMAADRMAEVERLRAALTSAKEALEHSIKWTAENSLLRKDHQAAIAVIDEAMRR